MKRGSLIADAQVEVIAMFTPLGILVGLYTTYAACTGSVYARRGAWGAMVVRDDEPVRFWTTIVCYGLLAIAMIAVF